MLMFAEWASRHLKMDFAWFLKEKWHPAREDGGLQVSSGPLATV